MGISRSAETGQLGFDSILLLPFALLYAIGWRAYQAIYDLGLKKPHIPENPTIVVGNLIAGGAGKSPTVVAIAELLLESGKDIVIGASGYGSPSSRDAQIAPAGPLDPGVWGDEPAMIRDALPDVPLVVSRDRVMAAQLVAQSYPGAVLLMDDGFQHLRLRPHIRIVLDPPGIPNPFCLPAGPYRQPRGDGRRRADLLLPGEFEVAMAGLSVFDASGEPAELPPRVQILTAIGRPERFHGTVEYLGASVVAGRFLPDHHALMGDVLAGFDPQIPVAVTRKDWVKLRQNEHIQPYTVLIVHFEASIEPADAFRAWLLSRLDAITS